MKTHRNYVEHEVVNQLKKKNDLRIVNKTIKILNQNGKGDIGIRSKGKIDFLTKYCGYQKLFVSSF